MRTPVRAFEAHPLAGLSVLQFILVACSVCAHLFVHLKRIIGAGLSVLQFILVRCNVCAHLFVHLKRILVAGL